MKLIPCLSLTITIIMLINTTSAQDNSNSQNDGYLIPTCEATLRNDYVNLIKVDDVDRDGIKEVLAGTSIQGILYSFIYKNADCTVDWSSQWTFNTKGDIRSIIVENLNEDNKNEILLNAVKSKIGDKPPSEYYFVLSEKGIEKWNFKKECGWTKSITTGDIDGSGMKNTIMGSLGGKICVIKDNSKDKNPVLWSYQAENPINKLLSKDLDGDGTNEVIALSYKYQSGQVIVLNNKGQVVWKNDIQGSIYTSGGLDKMAVEDLDLDGKYEVIVGTYHHGVDVFTSNGQLKWNYDTGGNLVSTIYVDDIDNNVKKEVLVGAKPNVYVIADQGRLLWRANVDTTVYNIHTADINQDGEKEVVVGSTRYVNVYDGSTGRLAGTWTYKEEIQGLTKAFQIKDANARSIQAADLDDDGDIELVVGFGWEEDQLDKTFHFGSLKVFEVNKSYTPLYLRADPEPIPPTTLKTIVETTTTTEPITMTTTLPKVDDDDKELDDEGSGLCCLPFLTGIFAIGASIVARIG